jgi:septal ring factor EnvC (AmiA/AmiB activator)
MTKKELEERLAKLHSEQELVRKNLIQLQANLNAYEGAIQECEHWLSQLDIEETPLEKKK